MKDPVCAQEDGWVGLPIQFLSGPDIILFVKYLMR